DVYAVLLPLRDSDRGAGRSDWSATGADTRGAVVVGLHVADRHDVELLPAAAHQVLLRRRRSRRVSERLDRRRALVPTDPAGQYVRCAADGQPDWRSRCTAA